LVRVHKNSFEFEASNSIPVANNSNEFQFGVSLSNVKRRLELIYPNSHQLEIKKENGLFSIRLKIQKNDIQIPDTNA
jgi:LytS/YehU family sensor histidine kinase